MSFTVRHTATHGISPSSIVVRGCFIRMYSSTVANKAAAPPLSSEQPDISPHQTSSSSTTLSSRHAFSSSTFFDGERAQRIKVGRIANISSESAHDEEGAAKRNDADGNGEDESVVEMEVAWLLRRGMPILESEKARVVKTEDESLTKQVLHTLDAGSEGLSQPTQRGELLISGVTNVSSLSAPSLKDTSVSTPPFIQASLSPLPVDEIPYMPCSRRRTSRSSPSHAHRRRRAEKAEEAIVRLARVALGMEDGGDGGSQSILKSAPKSPMWKLMPPKTKKRTPAAPPSSSQPSSCSLFPQECRLSLHALRVLLPPATSPLQPLTEKGLSEAAISALVQIRQWATFAMFEDWGYLSKRIAIESELFHVRQRHILALESGSSNRGAPRWTLEARSLKSGLTRSQKAAMLARNGVHHQTNSSQSTEIKLVQVDDGAHLLGEGGSISHSKSQFDGPDMSSASARETFLNKQLLGQRQGGELETLVGRGWEGQLVRELTDTVDATGATREGRATSQIGNSDAASLLSLPQAVASRWVDAAYKRVSVAGVVEPILRERFEELDAELELMDKRYQINIPSISDIPSKTDPSKFLPVGRKVATRLQPLLGASLVTCVPSRHADYEVAWDVVLRSRTEVVSPFASFLGGNGGGTDQERAVLGVIQAITENDNRLVNFSPSSLRAASSYTTMRPPNELTLTNSIRANSNDVLDDLFDDKLEEPAPYLFQSTLRRGLDGDRQSVNDSGVDVRVAVAAHQLSCVPGIWWAAYSVLPLVHKAFQRAVSTLTPTSSGSGVMGDVMGIGGDAHGNQTASLHSYIKGVLKCHRAARNLERAVVCAQKTIFELERVIPDDETRLDDTPTPVANLRNNTISELKSMINQSLFHFSGAHKTTQSPNSATISGIGPVDLYRMITRHDADGVGGDDTSTTTANIPSNPHLGLLPMLLLITSRSLAWLHKRAIVPPRGRRQGRGCGNNKRLGILGSTLVPLMYLHAVPPRRPIVKGGVRLDASSLSPPNVPLFAWRCLSLHERVVLASRRCVSLRRAARSRSSIIAPPATNENLSSMRTNKAPDDGANDHHAHPHHQPPPASSLSKATVWVEEVTQWLEQSYKELMILMIAAHYQYHTTSMDSKRENGGVQQQQQQQHAPLDSSFLACGDGEGVVFSKWTDAVQDRHNVIEGMWIHLQAAVDEGAHHNHPPHLREEEREKLGHSLAQLAGHLYRINRALPLRLSPSTTLQQPATNEGDSNNPAVIRWLEEMASMSSSSSSKDSAQSDPSSYLTPWERLLLDCRRRLSPHGQTLSEQINKIGKNVADAHDQANPTSAIRVQEEFDGDAVDVGISSSNSSSSKGRATHQLLRRRRYQFEALLASSHNNTDLSTTTSVSSSRSLSHQRPAATAALQATVDRMSVVIGALCATPSTSTVNKTIHPEVGVALTIGSFYMKTAHTCGRADWGEMVSSEVAAILLARGATVVPTWLLIDPLVLSLRERSRLPHGCGGVEDRNDTAPTHTYRNSEKGFAWVGELVAAGAQFTLPVEQDEVNQLCSSCGRLSREYVLIVLQAVSYLLGSKLLLPSTTSTSTTTNNHHQSPATSNAIMSVAVTTNSSSPQLSANSMTDRVTAGHVLRDALMLLTPSPSRSSSCSGRSGHEVSSSQSMRHLISLTALVGHVHACSTSPPAMPSQQSHSSFSAADVGMTAYGYSLNYLVQFVTHEAVSRLELDRLALTRSKKRLMSKVISELGREELGGSVRGRGSEDPLLLRAIKEVDEELSISTKQERLVRTWALGHCLRWVRERRRLMSLVSRAVVPPTGAADRVVTPNSLRALLRESPAMETFIRFVLKPYMVTKQPVSSTLSSTPPRRQDTTTTTATQPLSHTKYRPNVEKKHQGNMGSNGKRSGSHRRF